MADEGGNSKGRRDSALESPDLDVEFNWSKSLDESSTDGVLGLETNLDPTLDALDVSREQGEDDAVDDPVSCSSLYFAHIFYSLISNNLPGT